MKRKCVQGSLCTFLGLAVHVHSIGIIVQRNGAVIVAKKYGDQEQQQEGLGDKFVRSHFFFVSTLNGLM